MASDIRKQSEHIKERLANNMPTQSIEYSKRRVRDLTLILEAARLKTDQERQAHRGKLQPRIDQLSAKIESIEGPLSATGSAR